MKRIFLFTAVMCIMAVISCKKNKLGTVSFTAQLDFTTTIPAQPELPLLDTPVTVSADIPIQDKRLRHSEKASLKDFYVEIQAPSGQTFDFCREVHLFLSAPGVAETEIAFAENIDPNSTRIDFAVSHADMVQFIHQNSMTVKLKIRLGKSLSRPTTVYGNLMFNVQGRL